MFLLSSSPSPSIYSLCRSLFSFLLSSKEAHIRVDEASTKILFHLLHIYRQIADEELVSPSG